MGREFTAIVVTCEHGGNRVPNAFRHYFKDAAAALASHRGCDPGALVVARRLAKTFAAPLFYSTTSRLLVDLNRSPGHPRVFSEFTLDLGDNEHAEILAQYHFPYRAEVETAVGALIARGERVLHLSSHSFTPVMGRSVRSAEVGVLFDPKRTFEAEIARGIAREMAVLGDGRGWRIRRNYPYAGVADGLTTYLRRRYPQQAYAGIELEMNQSLLAVPQAVAAYARMVGEAVMVANAKLKTMANPKVRKRSQLSVPRRRRTK